jgi:uncharacterized membrane protein (UPF0127 family)
MKFITQNITKLIKNLPLLALLLLPFFFSACHSQDEKKFENKIDKPKITPKASFALPSGKLITLRLAMTEEEQERGLSGVSSSEFTTTDGMLFIYKETEPRRFWMPDTYFDLDIFFLDTGLTVIDIERKVLAHPGRDETLIPIQRTRTIMAKHVLEMRADSPLSSEIQKGQKLKWISEFLLP